MLQDMGFGVSQRLELERLKLSRERQLSKAIEEMKQVRKSTCATRPTKTERIRTTQSRSVGFGVPYPKKTGANLKQEEVDSVVDMVSSAVPGMKPNRITVTDQHGRLLSSGSQDPASAARRKEHELERKQEQALRDKN
ncbi:hypothetical protein QW180_04210 [Vibrio sinaloensis]|nr:hypothetical protein [Vibrio sinaloensis]